MEVEYKYGHCASFKDLNKHYLLSQVWRFLSVCFNHLQNILIMFFSSCRADVVCA